MAARRGSSARRRARATVDCAEVKCGPDVSADRSRFTPPRARARSARARGARPRRAFHSGAACPLMMLVPLSIAPSFITIAEANSSAWRGRVLSGGSKAARACAHCGTGRELVSGP
jgi:hypothetical protein